MKYIAKYLPVDRPWTDGCTIINSSGEHHIWDENSIGWPKHLWMVAELFIVSYEFNQLVILGQPATGSSKWVREGMEIKKCDVIIRGWDTVPGITPLVIQLDIKCPVCDHVADPYLPKYIAGTNSIKE